MGKTVRILSVFSFALLLVLGLSMCKEKGSRPFSGFDGTLIVTNNSDSTVVVEIDGSVKKSDLGPNSQWSTQLYQGPHTVKVRKTDGSDEQTYQVDIIAGATTSITYD